MHELAHLLPSYKTKAAFLITERRITYECMNSAYVELGAPIYLYSCSRWYRYRTAVRHRSRAQDTLDAWTSSDYNLANETRSYHVCIRKMPAFVVSIQIRR